MKSGIVQATGAKVLVDLYWKRGQRAQFSIGGQRGVNHPWQDGLSARRLHFPKVTQHEE